ncbi:MULTISPECIES: ABC transporter permease [unclassified Treponema]|uniref:ABC transporter permease n=1 Tax=unclassified Treponema TaxID=2638727 RepID=UPI0020A42343|nr:MULTISPECIES: ABC transporter permease [unclassified Treponema]UTC67444.1 ABC transporter permease [Treponema sp. OMZ 789]UTC70172.1 ABC transporter permease [Treponema sp. OMZ 790]UTC72887.1 ABC transporter permease [Treponema sp. OMZ 791]
MKKFLILFLAQLKRILKNTANMGMLIFFPFAMIILILVIGFIITPKKKENSEKNTEYTVQMHEVGYFVDDAGDLWENFFSGSESTVRPDNREEELEKLKEKLAIGKIPGLIIIPKDFSEKISKGEKPELEILKTEESVVLDNRIQALNLSINAYLLDNFIKNSDLSEKKDSLLSNNINVVFKTPDNGNIISLGLKIMTLLVLYIILFGSNAIAMDLIKFRETKMLARAIISPNSEFKIVGSFLSAFVFIQVVINMIVFVFATIVFKLEITGLPLIFLAVVSTSFFALSISILVARIFKKESQLPLVSNMTSLITIVMFFLALIAVMPFVSLPSVFKNISMLSPLYWLMEMLDKEKLFPNILIVWAMSTAIFTAGSWKIKEFNSEIN